MGRVIGGAVVGLVVTFIGVMAATWVGMAATGLTVDSPPTPAYLVLNLLGSSTAALIGGATAVRIARGRAAAGILVVLLILLLALPSFFSGTSGDQPAWYPVTVAALGLSAALVGTMLGRARWGHLRERYVTAPGG